MNNGIYCPLYIRSKPVQVFDIIVLNFILSFIENCSSLSELFISITRYKSLKDKNQNSKRGKYNKILRILINIIQFFQYKINDDFYSSNFPVWKFDLSYCYDFYYDTERMKCEIFFGFFFNSLFTFGPFSIILTLILDLFMLIKIWK